MQDIARGQIKRHGYYSFLAVKFKMAALLELVKLFSRKRRAEEDREFLTCQYKMNEEMAKKRCQREMEFEMEASEPAVLSAIVITVFFNASVSSL